MKITLDQIKKQERFDRGTVLKDGKKWKESKNQRSLSKYSKNIRNHCPISLFRSFTKNINPSILFGLIYKSPLLDSLIPIIGSPHSGHI
jgi:hypothetical protein